MAVSIIVLNVFLLSESMEVGFVGYRSFIRHLDTPPLSVIRYLSLMHGTMKNLHCNFALYQRNALI